ncbi:hypothetical protein AB2D15_34485, partial [Pseudomonas aeruginosa]
ECPDQRGITVRMCVEWVSESAWNPQTPSGHWVKRDAETGQFMDVKTSDKTPFKGVRKEK